MSGPRTFERTDGCIEWAGCKKPTGYGQLTVNKKRWIAHRYAWFLKHGPIPDGMFVLHRCDNPSCVNADHLFLGTHQDNMDDRERKRRNAIHRGEHNGQSKLTDSQVKEIRNRCKFERLTHAELAKEYGVHICTIDRVSAGVTWKHVPPKEPPR